MIEFEVEERKCIKPCKMTGRELRKFKVSLLDQVAPDIHGNITLFYSNNNREFWRKSQLLQTSLSETLRRFYPIAGRLHDASTIDCNDDGALFMESKTNASLSDILSPPDLENLNCLLPSPEPHKAYIFLSRFTSFRCGGTALTISLSHKIADMASLVAILKTWTAAASAAPSTTTPDHHQLIHLGSSLFPPRPKDIPVMSASVNTFSSDNFTTRRFVFEASKIRELKEMVAEGGSLVFEPSRVEVVLALIWKCALSASGWKPSVMFQAVNLRPRMKPAVPDAALGNFVWAFPVRVEEDLELELHVLVRRMRESMNEFIDTQAEWFKGEGAFGVVMDSLKMRGQFSNIFKCSSWCKFPLLHLDFGWGEPLWICTFNQIMTNTIAFIDTRDGGLEAFVTLDHQHMPLFQQHHHLLHYALLNPTIIL